MATFLPWSLKYSEIVTKAKGTKVSMCLKRRSCRLPKRRLSPAGCGRHGNPSCFHSAELSLALFNVLTSSVDRCLTCCHRHVGCVGDQASTLHDGLLAAIELDCELVDESVLDVHRRSLMCIPLGSPSTLQPSRFLSHHIQRRQSDPSSRTWRQIAK